jgi:hypothetical protein
VFSGRRFVDAAVNAGKPVVVINVGPTRADEVAACKVEMRLGEIMPLLADALAQVST